jgi:hypothetical protein
MFEGQLEHLPVTYHRSLTLELLTFRSCIATFLQRLTSIILRSRVKVGTNENEPDRSV